MFLGKLNRLYNPGQILRSTEVMLLGRVILISTCGQIPAIGQIISFLGMFQVSDIQDITVLCVHVVVMVKVVTIKTVHAQCMCLDECLHVCLSSSVRACMHDVSRANLF